MSNALYTPSTVAIASSTKGAQERLRAILKLSDDPSKWTYSQRMSYNEALDAEYAMHPEVYGPAAAQAAARYNPTRVDLQEYGFFAMTQDFFGEVANQAQDINPLSEKNRTQTKWTIWGTVALVIIALLFYFYLITRRAAP